MLSIYFISRSHLNTVSEIYSSTLQYVVYMHVKIVCIMTGKLCFLVKHTTLKLFYSSDFTVSMQILLECLQIVVKFKQGVFKYEEGARL